LRYCLNESPFPVFHDEHDGWWRGVVFDRFKVSGGQTMLRVKLITSSVSLGLTFGLGAHSRVIADPPPATIACELYAGESQLIDGACKITNLPDHQIRIEEVGGKGHVVLVKPEGYHDRLFWNGEPPEGEPTTLLGISQWLHNCWRSLPETAVPFTMCLTLPRRAR